MPEGRTRTSIRLSRRAGGSAAFLLEVLAGRGATAVPMGYLAVRKLQWKTPSAAPTSSARGARHLAATGHTVARIPELLHGGRRAALQTATAFLSLRSRAETSAPGIPAKVPTTRRCSRWPVPEGLWDRPSCATGRLRRRSVYAGQMIKPPDGPARDEAEATDRRAGTE